VDFNSAHFLSISWILRIFEPCKVRVAGQGKDLNLKRFRYLRFLVLLTFNGYYDPVCGSRHETRVSFIVRRGNMRFFVCAEVKMTFLSYGTDLLHQYRVTLVLVRYKYLHISYHVS